MSSIESQRADSWQQRALEAEAQLAAAGVAGAGVGGMAAVPVAGKALAVTAEGEAAVAVEV